MDPIVLANSTDFSLSGMWATMGLFAQLVILILGGQFVLAVAISFERYFSFARATRDSVRLIRELQPLLEQRDFETAIARAEALPNSPVAKVVETGLREYVGGLRILHEEGPDDVGDFDVVDAVHRRMERAKEREACQLERGLHIIATTGTTAPFVGLLGTVVGIINSFQGLSGDGGGGLSAVAGGISEALFATAVGLLVAIPCVMVYNTLGVRLKRFGVDMNDIASEIIDLVLKEGRY